MSDSALAMQELHRWMVRTKATAQRSVKGKARAQKRPELPCIPSQIPISTPATYATDGVFSAPFVGIVPWCVLSLLTGAPHEERVSTSTKRGKRE